MSGQMTRKAFEGMVAEIGFSPVPERFRDLIDNVALLVENDVSEETREEMRLDLGETLLGLYRGIPHTSRGEAYGVAGTLPDTITLYMLPIIQAALEDRVPVRKVIEDTIWHEIAHHFGLDEDAVRAKEAERR